MSLLARFHWVNRRDTPLAIGLIAAAVIIFQRPLHFFRVVVLDIQSWYQVDLVPALIILVGVFVFHEYGKRQEVRTYARAVAAEAEQARQRAEELERLMALGQAVASVLDRSALLQVLWRYVPRFAPDREFWALLWAGGRWTPLVQNAPNASSRTLDSLETIAQRALSSQAGLEGSAEGIADEEDVCFPMVAGGTVLGVLGIRDKPALSREGRRALGAATAVIAIGVRNIQLLVDTRDMSLRDNLTGCFNRGHAVERLDSELRRVRRSGQSLSIVMFDIDQFKTVNDRLGHVRGDELLRMVGALLPRILRVSDVRCRYGGDEFLVILPDTPLAGAELVAESLRREISALAFVAGEQKTGITASLGVATALSGESNAVNFIDRADHALYEAKHQGRNRVCTASTPAGSSAREARIISLAQEQNDQSTGQNR